MRNPSQNLMMLLLLALVVVVAAFKCHVHVINGFNSNESTLEAHCHSKDDDLGLRHVAVHEEFEWEFNTHFLWWKTKFWCHMWWSGGQKTLNVFWVNTKFINYECGGFYHCHCRWRSLDDGIYLYSFRHKQYLLRQKWEPWPEATPPTTAN